MKIWMLIILFDMREAHLFLERLKGNMQIGRYVGDQEIVGKCRHFELFEHVLKLFYRTHQV